MHSCDFFAGFTYSQKKKGGSTFVMSGAQSEYSANIVCWVCWLVALCFVTIEFRWTGYSLRRNRKQFALNVLLQQTIKMSCNTRGCASWRNASGKGWRSFKKVISVIKNKTVGLSRNVWRQLPSDGVPHNRTTEISATPLQKSKNWHKLCSSSAVRCFH